PRGRNTGDGGKNIKGSIAELGPEWDDDPNQKANLDRYRAELAKLDFPADRTGLVASLPTDLPADYRVAGTQECRRCHADDCQRWDETRHAAAWETLVSHDAQFDPSCQQCHTTGYGLPGGFVSVATANEATQVGCESCHGPSLAHARRPVAKTLYAAADRCVTCHDRENSPEFEYAVYWEQIEHGRSAERGVRNHE
ncbi:MAG TPA: cytochrome c family protein, partial [Pirellulales bacterium]|nr:cytochrome c family protein [Pirellulales bacterium]